MEKEEFKELLKKAELSNKELENILDLAQQTTNCWGRKQNIPYWVKTLLINYIKANEADKIVKAIKEIESINEK